MNAFPKARRSVKNIIGKFCMVRDLKSPDRPVVSASVVDRVARTNHAKRIRLQTGEHAGETRMLNEYELLEFVNRGDAPGVLASVWPD